MSMSRLFSQDYPSHTTKLSLPFQTVVCNMDSHFWLGQRVNLKPSQKHSLV